MHGTASFAQSSVVEWLPADSPIQLRSMSVSITPGLKGIAAMPAGSSSASARVSPSMANFDAQ
jgi:hypothetical protein